MLSGDCNICINGKMPSYSATCVECGLSRKNYKPQTNADRIRAMTDVELAETFEAIGCPQDDTRFPCAYPDGSDEELCQKCWLDWLRQEAET